MPELAYSFNGRRWRADLSQPVDLAVTLQFAGPQPRFFADGPARSEPLRAGGFTGSVAAGASCNCQVHTLAPHCHGTHTECVGHVCENAPSVAALTPVPPALAVLASVHAEPLGTHAAAAAGQATAADPVITRAALAAAVAGVPEAPWTALVVRTRPNDLGKAHRHYEGPCPAPYFTPDAMRWIVERGVSSLVVDLPSLDRADDGGALAAHRLYWGLPPGGRDARRATRARALVTELAWVPDSVPDGLYLLDLQVPAFASDAAPSRPVLYPATEIPA